MHSGNCDTNSDHAEILAMRALAFLADNEQHFTRFLSLTGANVTTLKEGVQDRETLASVMDYMLQDEALLLAWCNDSGLRALDVVSARRRLPGFEEF